MSENYHYVQLTVESGELHRAFVCTAPADANCRRRPANWEDMESWSPSESDESGFPCWAVEFVNEAGIEDAVYAHPDGVLASFLVSIPYADGVEVTPVLADQGKPQITARPSDAALVDLYWKASGDDWAIPDWLMVKYGRAVLEAALGGAS